MAFKGRLFGHSACHIGTFAAPDCTNGNTNDHRKEYDSLDDPDYVPELNIPPIDPFFYLYLRNFFYMDFEKGVCTPYTA